MRNFQDEYDAETSRAIDPPPSRDAHEVWTLWDSDLQQEHTSSPDEHNASPQEDSTENSLLTELETLVRELLETVILTLIIFTLVRIPTQTFRIEGISMEPNFTQGQYMIVNKAAYWWREPQRGDVIIFRFAGPDPSLFDDIAFTFLQIIGKEEILVPRKDYIKRIIGLPGETVEVREGRVYINGQPLDEPWNPYTGSYTKLPVTLGPDEYYVLGDNRNNSSDSHTWGPIKRDRIIGKVWFVYWPPTLRVDRLPLVGPFFATLFDTLGIRLDHQAGTWGPVPTYPDPLEESNHSSFRSPSQSSTPIPTLAPYPSPTINVSPTNEVAYPSPALEHPPSNKTYPPPYFSP